MKHELPEPDFGQGRYLGIAGDRDAYSTKKTQAIADAAYQAGVDSVKYEGELPELTAPDVRNPNCGSYFDSWTKDKVEDFARQAIAGYRAKVERSEPVVFITPLMEQQMFDDWCPYKGNPDPRTVWAAATEAINGLLLGATPQPAPAAQPDGLSRLEPFVHGMGRSILRELLARMEAPAARPALKEMSNEMDMNDRVLAAIDDGCVALYGDHPITGRVWFRKSTNEWVLELSGSINSTSFTARHTQPAEVLPEDVPSLSTLYAVVPQPPAQTVNQVMLEAVMQSDIDFLPYDDSLRFIQRTIESNAAGQDRDDALKMVRDIRRSIRPAQPENAYNLAIRADNEGQP